MDWGTVWAVIVAMAIFLLAVAMIGATLVWLMVRKLKKGVQAGASRKSAFPCAEFFSGKTGAATR